MTRVPTLITNRRHFALVGLLLTFANNSSSRDICVSSHLQTPNQHVVTSNAIFQQCGVTSLVTTRRRSFAPAAYDDNDIASVMMSCHIL